AGSGGELGWTQHLAGGHGQDAAGAVGGGETRGSRRAAAGGSRWAGSQAPRAAGVRARGTESIRCERPAAAAARGAERSIGRAIGRAIARAIARAVVWSKSRCSATRNRTAAPVTGARRARDADLPSTADPRT